MDKTRPEFEDGDEEQVENQWPFASIAVRDDTEDDLRTLHVSCSSIRTICFWSLTAPAERKRSVRVMAVVYCRDEPVDLALCTERKYTHDRVRRLVELVLEVGDAERDTEEVHSVAGPSEPSWRPSTSVPTSSAD